MNLITVEPRTSGTLMEPFSLMRDLLRWDPARDYAPLPEGRSFLPAFDIRETPEGYLFTADLPGLKQEDLDIQLAGNRLTLSGKREAERRAEQETWFVRERTSGSFTRTFSLPEGVDTNAITADLKDGVLTLMVPKAAEVKPRRVEIRTV